MDQEHQLTTFEIKMTILTIMGSNAEVEKAKALYDWILEEVEIEKVKKGEVTHLKSMN